MAKFSGASVDCG